MELAGRRFAGAADVLDALRAGWTSDPRDEAAWGWLETLCARAPESRPWVDEATRALFTERLARDPSGRDFIYDLRQVVLAAQWCRVRGVAALAAEALASGKEWPDPVVARLLEFTWSFDSPAASPALVTAAARAAHRPGCFPDALRLLVKIAPAEAARLVEERLVEGIAGLDTVAAGDTLRWLASTLFYELSAHRDAVVAALARTPRPFLQRFRRLVKEAPLTEAERAALLAQLDAARPRRAGR